MDISETGVQIGEKLALLLNEKQQKELAQYLLEDIVSIVFLMWGVSYSSQNGIPIYRNLTP